MVVRGHTTIGRSAAKGDKRFYLYHTIFRHAKSMVSERIISYEFRKTILEEDQGGKISYVLHLTIVTLITKITNIGDFPPGNCTYLSFFTCFGLDLKFGSARSISKIKSVNICPNFNMTLRGGVSALPDRRRHASDSFVGQLQ